MLEVPPRQGHRLLRQKGLCIIRREISFFEGSAILMHDSHNESSGDGTVPWFPSPMNGWNEETESFSPRHEASTIELFFDLWFVGQEPSDTQLKPAAQYLLLNS